MGPESKASHMRRIFVVTRPRKRPIARHSAPPFAPLHCADGRAQSCCRRGYTQSRDHPLPGNALQSNVTRGGQCIEKTAKYLVAAPPVEANVDRVHSHRRSNQWRLMLIAEMFWQRPPMCAGARQPQNGFHRKPIVSASAARVSCFARKINLHLGPDPIT